MTDYRGPGEGAEEVASRAARRAEKLRRERDMAGATDSAVEAELARALRTQRNWSQGAEGERLVASTLGALERYGWLLLHDIRWPGRQKANIDHVAIGPGGVVVVDTKYWSGSAVVTDGVLRCDGYSKAKECESVASQAADVTALLRPEQRSAVRGVIALAAHDTDPTAVGPILVVGRAHLGPWLVGLPARLNPFDVVEIATRLRAEQVPAHMPTGPRRQVDRQNAPRQYSPRQPAPLPRPPVAPSYREPVAPAPARSTARSCLLAVFWGAAIVIGVPLLAAIASVVLGASRGF